MILPSLRKNRDSRTRKNWLTLAIFVSLLFVGAVPVYAYTTYAPGQDIVLGDFVYDDDFVATTTPCYITIFAPYGATIVNGAAMTVDANGWHYYNFSSTTQGTWPTQMQCGSVPTGDLVKEDRTFVIATSSAPTTAEITTAVAANVNAHTDSALLIASSSLYATLPGTIWAYSSRTLSSFGTLVADIWLSGTRTLTSGTAIAADIWAATTRTLTGAGLTSGSLATQSDVTTASTSIASVVNGNTNSTITTASSSIAAVVNGNTNTQILTASTSLGASITALPASIWNVATSTMTTVGSIGKVLATNIDAAISSISGGGALTASDVWTYATRTLTGAGLTSGSLATNVDINLATTSVNTTIGTASSSIAAVVNGNTNTQILTASTSLGASITALPASIWNVATSTMTTVGSIGKVLATNIDAAISSISGGGALTASDVWTYATRTLTGATLSSGSLATQSDVTTASTSIASVVNGNTNSAITTASTSIASVVNSNTNTQTAGVTSSVNSNTNATVLAASTSLAVSIPTNVWNSSVRTLSSFGTLASDVWISATRTLTGAGLTSGSLATQADVTTASSSLAAVVNANTNAQTSGIASSVNANTNSVVGNASTSLAASIASVPASVWTYVNRTLTSGASIASDIWAASTRTLTSLTLSSQSPWTVAMSDFGTISAGEVYRATVTTVYNGTLTDSLIPPTVIVYDPNRNVVVNGASMTRTSVGTYEYTYTTSGSDTAGVWETIISANVETGKTLPGNDYWNVSSSPPQVIIQSMNSTVVPNISANTRITNEGGAPYEYTYEWCVVSNPANVCGGGDDVDYSSAAKLINPGENFDTVLSATVPVPGVYYFKVAVYYGTEVSRATRQFTATSATGGGGTGGGGGGGGSGGGSTPPPTGTCSSLSADLNCDGRVNSVDFSILLAFWKTLPPFRNPYVDINSDTKVNAVDFSIMLYQWGMVSST